MCNSGFLSAGFGQGFVEKNFLIRENHKALHPILRKQNIQGNSDAGGVLVAQRTWHCVLYHLGFIYKSNPSCPMMTCIPKSRAFVVSYLVVS